MARANQVASCGWQGKRGAAHTRRQALQMSQIGCIYKIGRVKSPEVSSNRRFVTRAGLFGMEQLVDQFSRAVKLISVPASAFDTGQFCFAPRAYS